jgi:hypothetical protein
MVSALRRYFATVRVRRESDNGEDTLLKLDSRMTP